MSNETAHLINIETIASLARIELTEEEKTRFTGELEKILAHFDKLKTVDVSGIEPMAHPFPVYNVWEDDEIKTPFTPEVALMNAPRARDHQVVVPQVIE